MVLNETSFSRQEPKACLGIHTQEQCLGLSSEVWKRLFSWEVKNTDLQMPCTAPPAPGGEGARVEWRCKPHCSPRVWIHAVIWGPNKDKGWSGVRFCMHRKPGEGVLTAPPFEQGRSGGRTPGTVAIWGVSSLWMMYVVIDKSKLSAREWFLLLWLTLTCRFDFFFFGLFYHFFFFFFSSWKNSLHEISSLFETPDVFIQW